MADNVSVDNEHLRMVQGAMKQRLDSISACLDGDVLDFPELFEYAQELIYLGWQSYYWLAEPRDDWEGM